MSLINVAADPPGHLWYFVSQNDEDFLIHPDSPPPQFDSLSILHDDEVARGVKRTPPTPPPPPHRDLIGRLFLCVC